MLQMMRLGVKYQNAFSLPQLEFRRGDGKTVYLWGEVIDMGTTNRRRPQFLTQALANSVIGGQMLQTVQTGANPTWNQTLSSDKVSLVGAHELQSFAFNNNESVSVVLFNLSQNKASGVTLSGANAPSGTVQISQITSENITDNNENANTVQTTTRTLSAFNSASTLSLPPFSMIVLTSSLNAVQAPSFSVAGGTYESAQIVSLSDATAGATIYYTRDGSTPDSNWLVYSSPITVNSSQTINAIATVSGLLSSSVDSATYIIESSSIAAATPVLSPAPGTYANTQIVSISDSTPKVTIYYSINGGSRLTYSGPITVSSTATVTAIASASNVTTSTEIAGTYTIQAAEPAAGAPIFSVAAGTYTAAQKVALNDSTSNSTIYYTTNGDTPTTTSAKYMAPITVSQSVTIKAIAVASSHKASPETDAAYIIQAPRSSKSTDNPTFSLAPGTYASAQTLALEDTASGAIIYSSLNGASAKTYRTPLTITANTTVKIIAVANAIASDSVTATYLISSQPPQATQIATPTFSVPPGTYNTSQTISLQDATEGTTIYYSLNGGLGMTYSAPLLVSSNTTLKVIAVDSNHNASDTVTATYVIKLQ